nr:unnamed protein product [Amyelois transitella]
MSTLRDKFLFLLVTLSLYIVVVYGDELLLKDESIDRGAHSDRSGLWFGPRLGKRSYPPAEDERDILQKLLEAAANLKYESDLYERATESEAKGFFTPRPGRSQKERQDPRRRYNSNVDFTPRLGRGLNEDLAVSDEDLATYYAVRASRKPDFTPRLGRELVGYISVIVTVINGEILFAANIDDFKAIAKKYVPEQFAEKLAKIAAETSLFNNKNVISLSRIDLDELVEKIKERLDAQYLEKYKNYVNNVPHPVVNDKTSLIRGQPKPDPVPEKADYDYTNQGKVEEFEDNANVRNQQSNNMNGGNNEPLPEGAAPFFEEKYLTNTKDSYEEYEMKVSDNVPKKSENTPVQKSNTNAATTHNYQVSTSKKLEQRKPSNPNSEVIQKQDDNEKLEYDYKAFKSDEIKAKTENLNYDYHTYKMKLDNMNGKTPTTRKTFKGSGIPTRERFSMSSPNYYASVPVVAEKYDFNEPLPDRDREPEDLKYLENQPAKINKKCL